MRIHTSADVPGHDGERSLYSSDEVQKEGGETESPDRIEPSASQDSLTPIYDVPNRNDALKKLNGICNQELIHIKVIKESDFQKVEQAEIQYHYMYWAAMRGNPFIVNYIVKNYKISPFIIAIDGRSPFLYAIEKNQTSVVRYILSKNFQGEDAKGSKLIERSKQECDQFGNNPMHKACRFKNAQMIKLLLD